MAVAAADLKLVALFCNIALSSHIPPEVND